MERTESFLKIRFFFLFSAHLPNYLRIKKYFSNLGVAMLKTEGDCSFRI